MIGKGGIGAVYVIEHISSSRVYALKRVRKARIVRKKLMDNIFAERDALRELNDLRRGCAFIVQLHRTFADKMHLNFLLEFVQGGDLLHWLHKRKRFAENETLFYAAELISALSQIHAEGFIYRDLKLENVVLAIDGHLKIVDFGFCKKCDRSGRLFSTVGTPHYLAPEMLDRSNRGGYTNAVDWWAFACLVYELLTGRSPFGKDGDSKYAVWTKIVQGHKPKIPSRAGGSEIQDLLSRMFERNWGDRLCDEIGIRAHTWFRCVDWDDVVTRSIIPPVLPNATSKKDTFHFEKCEEDPPEPATKLGSSSALRRSDDALFAAF